MNTKQLANMLMLFVGFLMLYAAARMAWAVGRGPVEGVSPTVAETVDYLLA